MISRIPVPELKIKGQRMFQSRNRGSFDFKFLLQDLIGVAIDQFQSRNRGSFDFKVRVLAHSSEAVDVSIS